ncbi:MAG: DNA polymerase I [Chloroflexota bacterium]|nr:DNA polymerase I [Chloroflexota bacterium]
MTTESPVVTDDRPTLLLVDGYGLIFRAYHALPSSIGTSAGEQVNAVFGFASMLLDVLRNERPDYAIIALEGGKTFREEEFAEYKANRGEMPDDLRSQVTRVRELIEALGIPIEERPGYEADDVIGSLSRKCSTEGDLRVVIVTGDSDLLQLVDDNVVVVLPGSQRFGELRLFDRAAVEKRYGFGPEHVPDYKALVGDTSDNIPGVPGIGDKTAKALISQFGDIERIIEQVNEVTPTRARNAIEANVETARRSKRLATIVRDLDIAIDRERSAVGNYDREAVIDLFRRLEFRSLVNRLPEATNGQPPATTREVVARPPSNRTIVRTEDEIQHLISRMREVGSYAVDVETDSTDPQTARLVGIAIGVSAGEGYYIPLAHRVGDGDQLSFERVHELLGPILADPALAAYAHHGKYDVAVLERHGYTVGRLGFDTMVAGYLLNQTSLRLKDMAFTRLGIEMTEITALIGTGRNQLTMDKVDSAIAGEYACGDVEATYELTELLRAEITEQHLDPLLFDIELPLVPVLVDIESVGIAVDVAFLAEFSTEITARMGQLEAEIHAVAGREININSTRQLATLLFEELGLPSGRKTKTGYSVDGDMLETIRDRHPIIDLILEYRQLGKLKSTYVDALPLQVNQETGRVHTSFNQTVAATGRLSSTNPNLQNIPIRTEQGRRVRRAFVADHRPEFRLFDDAVLLAADYSQIELRLLAHLSGEPFLIEAFSGLSDIHRATAAIVYGIDPGDVTTEMRRVAKTVNFGVLYGMQAYGLSRDTGLPRAEAQRFITDYWARLPRVKAYFDEILRFGAAHGYVWSESGRRRFLPDLTSSNGARRMAAERMAINMPIQGGAADIMKIAMNHLAAKLAQRTLKARVLLQVHDELVLEVDRSDLAETAALVRATMENAVELRVPIAVEVGVGDNWEEMTELSGGG